MPVSKPRPTTLTKDPRLISVQMSIRMPFWRREQLDDEAANMRVTTAALILDAVDRVYPPDPPK